MAGKAGAAKGTKGKSPDYGGYTFLNVGLSTDDKTRLAETDRSVEFPLESILDMVLEGYKFTIREDVKNNTFMASLTDIRPESPTYKVILSGRGSTAINAWYALAYRHVVLLVDGWGSFVSEEGTFDFD